MTKKMLINATHPEENRVAIVEDGILTELDIEIAGKEQTKGNIYKATVVRVEPGLQAAFIDYGAERLGFLQMGELHPSYFRSFEKGDGKSRPRINDVLHRGQELLIQVVKEERGTKGAALTTFISLPGRYMVLMPGSDSKGVSRKIEEESQRKKLKEIMASLDLPEEMGYIVRTAAIGQKKEELKRDFDYLVRVWNSIQAQSSQMKAPALVYKESNLAIRSLRDYFSSDMEEVLVDDSRVFQETRDFFQEVMPEYARLVKLHQERRPIFSRYQIEEQIETITKNRVALPSGGSIVIDTTEALVAIDVNSGKMVGEQGVEATAYRTNLEAAAEAGRQLRLRDLGGLIVIDFIDMRDKKHIREVEKALKDALKHDKARVTVGRISQFGLLEMSRQRIKPALAEGSYIPCPHCNGSGRVKSAEAQAIAFLRKIHAAVAKGQVGRVEGEIPLEVATYLLNSKREELLEMERQHQMMVVIKGRPDFLAGQSELTVQKREKEESLLLESDAAAAASIPLLAPLPTLKPEAVPPAPEESQTPAASEAATAEEGARKKKKRRRKKKKGEEPQAAEALQEEAADSEGEEEEAEAAAEESAGESPLEAAVGQTSEEKKKKRRRRRRKKPSSGEGETSAAASDVAGPTLELPKSPPEESPPPPAEPVQDKTAAQGVSKEPGDLSAREEKPRPKRRPRTRRAAQKTEAAPSAPEAPSPAREEAPLMETASPESAVSAPPPRKRPARKKPAEKSGGETEGKAAEPKSPSETSSAEEPSAAAPEKKKPARRTPRRRPPAEKKEPETDA